MYICFDTPDTTGCDKALVSVAAITIIECCIEGNPHVKIKLVGGNDATVYFDTANETTEFAKKLRNILATQGVVHDL